MAKTNERYTIEEVDYATGGVNNVSEQNRFLIAKSLSLLDKKIVDRVVKEVHFFDGFHCKAFHLPLNTIMLKDKKTLIFLSESLNDETEEEAIKIILHEVAHHYLNHKCLFDVPIDDEKEKKKYSYQEIEADKLKDKWINNQPLKK